MSRLAVGIEPPGGFWKNPRNLIKQCRNRWQMVQFQSNKAQHNIHISKTSKTTPLTSDPRSKHGLNVTFNSNSPLLLPHASTIVSHSKFSSAIRANSPKVCDSVCTPLSQTLNPLIILSHSNSFHP